MDEEDDWLYTLIGTAPPKPTIEKEIEERIINKKIPKAEDLGQYQLKMVTVMLVTIHRDIGDSCHHHLKLIINTFCFQHPLAT